MKTLIVSIREKDNAIDMAASCLKKGGLIIYPTETQYGIGADVTNRRAVKKVFAVKQRPTEKKVIWAFSDVRMIKSYSWLDKSQERLVRRLMPGPFTLVINNETFRFRIPDKLIVRKIIKKFGKPITTTSANISGKDTPTKIKEIISIFDGKVDLIIDAGNLPKRRPSTVFRWEDRKILRRGPISKKEILKNL